MKPHSLHLNLGKRHISRRTLLKGLGTVAVGLPWLDEMLVASASASPSPPIPVRAFNVFFGLGIPAPLQLEGFNGVLEPLQPLSTRLLLLRNVDQIRCDERGSNAHYDGSTAAFTAEPPNGTARAGGPSIDQAIRAAHYPNGLPPGVVPSLLAGTFFRRDRLTRFAKSFREDGTVAGVTQETPRQLFERVFGSTSTSEGSNIEKQRLKRSILDSLVEQYRYYTGELSPLSAASKARLADHLDRIREFEKRVHDARERNPGTPSLPPRSKLLHGREADPGGEGIDISIEDLTAEWRLMADLYALAIQTDRVRFGSITFLAAGERIRLKGTYEYAGRSIFQFDDAAQRRRSGAQGCSHEWWHDFDESRPNQQLRAHAHMKMREVAYFLGRLAGPEAMEPNGKSILENSLFTVSTESGDGRHSNVKRELSGVFHAITSANGTFKTGETLDVSAEGLDLYNTMLKAMGVSRRLGPARREFRPVDDILA